MTALTTASTGAEPAHATDSCLDGPLVCEAVHHVTHDVRSFVLSSPTADPFRFEAGQYVTVTVEVDGRPMSRCYTIASPPTRPDTITLTVKRIPGGPVSTWLHANLRPGQPLAVTGPLGRFGQARTRARRQLHLSAGSGITPSLSMARTIVDDQDDVDVVLVHHARTPADIIERRELDTLGDRHRGIRVAVVCSGDAPDEVWPGPRGRVTAEQLHAVAPDLADREVFLCGPTGYRAAARAIVLAAGVPAHRVHEESYLLGDTVDSPAVATGPSRTHTVELRRSGLTVSCDERTPVLQAVADAGVWLPSSCQEGMCGTCKTTMLSGSVDMKHAGGIRPREVAQNKILLCCSTPTDDLVLDA